MEDFKYYIMFMSLVCSIAIIATVIDEKSVGRQCHKACIDKTVELCKIENGKIVEIRCR